MPRARSRRSVPSGVRWNVYGPVISFAAPKLVVYLSSRKYPALIPTMYDPLEASHTGQGPSRYHELSLLWFVVGQCTPLTRSSYAAATRYSGPSSEFQALTWRT